MKRWHDDYKITLREWKKHRNLHVQYNMTSASNRIGLSPYEVDCKCDEQKGRFRKIDALDCGHARCYLCHSDKFKKRSKTKKELDFDLKYEESLRELHDGTDA